MSYGSTLMMPSPSSRRSRRAGRRVVVILVTLLVILGLAIGADRAAVAYADSQIATQMQSHGFSNKPQVSIRGFPFLTQVASRDIQDIHISDSHLKKGPVTLSLAADATGVKLNSNFKSGIISHVDGSGLISFSDLASIASAAGAPGIRLTADGPHRVKMTVDLQVITASAVASIKQTSPDTFRVHITSTDGIPPSLLGSLQSFTVQVPPLPLGLTIQSVGVTSQGVLIRVAGDNISFGQ